MKIRYIAIVFTIIMAVLMVVSQRYISNNSNVSIDMVKINECTKSAGFLINDGIARDEIEERCGCELLLRKDTDYESKVMSAIKSKKIVIDYIKGDKLLGKFIFSGDNEKAADLYNRLKKNVLMVYLVIIFIAYFFMFIIYFYYIKPFNKLKSFASSVAKGNLDLPLRIQRSNYFGAFTESFDMMREELRCSKENEYRANISKKELVAELSHDMKTPIATIKATCDVLKLKTERGILDSSKETIEKVKIIEQKADMIDQLISNMFNASLEDMETLKVFPELISSLSVVAMFEELKYYGTITITSDMPECLVYIDILRLKQVIDNVINNSFKYADTEVQISFSENDKGIIIEIRDFGEGVNDDDLPLVTEKFYRGKNGAGKSGAGLGLYLAKYFMVNMKGDMECYNDNGFIVNLFLHKAGIDE